MKSIKKNYIYNSLYQILLIILPLITTPYIARIMGPSGVGIYSYSYSIAHYFVIISMLGINNYGTRSIAKVRDDKNKLTNSFWDIYYLQLFLALAMSVLYFAFVVFVVKEYEIIYILQFIYVISAAFDVNWFCFGMENFKLTVTRNIVVKVASVIAIFLFVNSADDLWIYTLIMASSVLISQLAIWPFIISKINFKKPVWSSIRIHLKPNLTLFVPVIAISLYTIMDKIMLGMMSNVTQVGFYTNAEKIINIARSLIVALGVVMLPRMSNLVAKGDFKKIRALIKKSMIIVLLMSSAMAFFIPAIAPTFVPWFLGENFTESAHLASWLSIILIIVSWANVIRTQYLIPNSRDKIYIFSVIAGALVNLFINMMLIPSMYSMGAVIGTICAELSVCVIQTIAIRNELEIKTYIKNGFPFLIFGALMFIAVRSLSTISADTLTIIILQVFAGVTIYLILSTIYLVKIIKEFEIVNSVLSLLHIKYRLK
ncbi:oligosaccharide flippase family protein [Siminovitchia sp. 179-K 8D1 HS]|uniref:oligosaccharide flippase family protein n=1 Tax=Siminovitchia sp. 179-K 8D1 HS TaxID=3142385 RepID=UPI0039A11A6E